MKKERIESGERMLGVSTIRALCTALIFVVAVSILGWMYIEREKVESCAKYGQPYPTEKTPAPVQVIVQQPQINATTKPPWDYNWDRKAWKNVEDAKGVGTRTLIFIRHGHYDFPSGKLTEMGRKQANITGQRLRELNMPYQKIFHSTMIRAQETAEIIRPHLSAIPVTADDILIEGGPTPPKPTITYWGLPERSYFVDGPRMEAAFRKYMYRADASQKEQTHELIVAHGNVIRYFVLRALQLSPEAWMRVFIAHASITVLHINPDGTVQMNKFGDCGHFPPAMISY